MINKKIMENLRRNIGKTVTVKSVWYGQPQTYKGRLKAIENFVNLNIGSVGIPFVGYGSAVRRVITENGQVLYENPLIPPDYDLRGDEEIDRMKASTFGDTIASESRQEREKGKQEWDKKVARLNEEAKAKVSIFIEQGEKLIKPHLKRKWKNFVTKNTKDFYSAGVVEASLKVIKALSEGKSPKEADEVASGMGITGFQMGCVARTVSYFHPHGEEFRRYWNLLYLSEEKAQKTKGVVNPAILTISPKGGKE